MTRVFADWVGVSVKAMSASVTAAAFGRGCLCRHACHAAMGRPYLMGVSMASVFADLAVLTNVTVMTAKMASANLAGASVVLPGGAVRVTLARLSAEIVLVDATTVTASTASANLAGESVTNGSETAKIDAVDRTAVIASSVSADLAGISTDALVLSETIVCANLKTASCLYLKIVMLCLTTVSANVKIVSGVKERVSGPLLWISFLCM